jgi:hypothetical protein
MPFLPFGQKNPRRAGRQPAARTLRFRPAQFFDKLLVVKD